MHRQIVYSGQVPLSTDVLNAERNALIGMGLLALDVFGSSVLVGGLACTQTTPSTSLAVKIGAGRIYYYTDVDNNAYSGLTADTTDMLVKQGILLQPTTLSTPAPVTNGYSVNYLIQVCYTETDAVPVVLPYYDSANPASPYSGQNNSGVAQNTQRQGNITISAKVGVAAPTGTQTTPAADSGYTGLYVVTVAYGQAAVTNSNITTLAGAPILTETLTQKISQATGDARYLQITVAAATYAPILNAGLQGTPTAPTPGAGDNSTRLATTSFTTAAVAAEATARASADSAEATTRANADSAEATTRANADSAEATARANGDATTLSTAQSYALNQVNAEASARASADASTLSAAQSYAQYLFANGFASSLSSSGYKEIYDGTHTFILQWVMVNGSNNGAGVEVCTYPMTFPNFCAGVVASSKHYGTGSVGTGQVQNITDTDGTTMSLGSCYVTCDRDSSGIRRAFVLLWGW